MKMQAAKKPTTFISHSLIFLISFTAQWLHRKAAAHKQHNHHWQCVSRSPARSKHSCQNTTSNDERQGDSAPVTELSMLPHFRPDINKACTLSQKVSFCQLHIHLSKKTCIHTWFCWRRFWIASVKCLGCLVTESVMENLTAAEEILRFSYGGEDDSLYIFIKGRSVRVDKAQSDYMHFEK